MSVHAGSDVPGERSSDRCIDCRRVGFFGGSFDPVHRGHLHAARAARDAFLLDRVLLAPAAVPPHKRGDDLAPPNDRLEMIRLAAEGETGLEPSTLDLRGDGPSYTIDVLRRLAAELTESGPFELFLVIGSDALVNLARWRGIDEILRAIQPIVVFRGGDPVTLLAGLSDRLAPDLVSRVTAGFLHLPHLPVSGSDIRRMIRSGEDPGELLPTRVLAYIRKRHLYATRGRGEPPGNGPEHTT